MLQATQADRVTDSGPLIRLNPADNVLIARAALSLGQPLSLGGATVRLRAQVP
ncbi:altronate dehydratase, partial [Ralstonia pseudosolanacearum]